MPMKRPYKRPPAAAGNFRVEGRANLEGLEDFPKDMRLKAYVFDRAGQTLGAADVDAKGAFTVDIDTTQPMDIQVVIAPEGDPQTIRKSAAFSQSYSAKDWKGDARKFRLRSELMLPRDIWSLWWPTWICVTGHVRKKFERDGVEQTCPVPYVKVEIFDVDREDCWWPYLRRWWDVLIDKPVFRIPDLLKERPFPKPFPWPEPSPIETVIGPEAGFEARALNPQPLPPEPPPAGMMGMSPTWPPSAVAASPSFVARLDKLTLTSRIAPWFIFPWCFYSRQLVCETTTDNCGYFRCCFRWWPFHFRLGRFRFDPRPDIIIKVTQVINGVATVIYMDPYSSTRWNVTNTHIDLYVDNPDVQCGSCDDPTRPEGTQVFLTRVGNDEVYWINQITGTYARPPSLTNNMAYGNPLGDPLRIFAQFGDTLSRHLPIAGTAAPYFYKLSYSTDGVTFTPITASLADTRVDKITLFSEGHTLGPFSRGSESALYEIRDFANYLWYNPDWIGAWDTAQIEPDTNSYTLRLEVFDNNGVKLTSAKVDYRDGTVMPPAVLPSMVDHCDLKIMLDNKPPVVDFTVPAVINECGVIPWSAVPPLNFNISVSQENGRLHSWGFQYTKGVNPTVHLLDSGSSNNGAPASVNKTVDGTSPPSGIPSMLTGVTTTCAFALKLWGWAHIRNGYGLVYYHEQIKAIAIEKCP
jgi:hypothetical protein